MFVCHCGANISSVVDVPSVVEYAKGLPNVVHAQEQLFSCATNSAQEITDITKEKGLNRVVVAACSPTHPGASVPRHPAGGGHKPVLLRDGQHPGAQLLGAFQGKGRGHRQGQGHRAHVRGPGLPPGALAGHRPSGQQGGPGGGRRRGRHELRAIHRQPGARGAPERKRIWAETPAGCTTPWRAWMCRNTSRG